MKKTFYAVGYEENPDCIYSVLANPVVWELRHVLTPTTGCAAIFFSRKRAEQFLGSLRGGEHGATKEEKIFKVSMEVIR